VYATRADVALRGTGDNRRTVGHRGFNIVPWIMDREVQ
jgi:hypothetical protein